VRALGAIRAAIASVLEALSNDGIRRLELVWSVGLAADLGLLVVLFVSVYAQDGAVAAGVLGAVRMGPAVLAGMLASSALERFNARRLLLASGLVRTAAAALVALVLALDGPSVLLYVLAAAGAVAGSVVRPAAASIMPAVARSPGELVAANMAWSTGEGLGTFVGPLVVGVLIAAGQPALAAAATAVGFLATALVVLGLRFEQAMDATGGARPGGRFRLFEGLAALRRRPVAGWTMVGVFTQVLSRGLLGPLTVVASIELLGMGEPGVGLLNAALGLGGLFGVVFALGVTRGDRIIRTMCVSLAYWGAPIAVIAILPFPVIGLAAMVVIGVSNAIYDVVLFTTLQRGTANDERAPVFSVLEGTAGLATVIGSLLAPALLAAFGVRGALAVSGAILPLAALVIYSRIGRADKVSVIDDELVALVRQVPLFRELPLTAVERLSTGLRPRIYEAAEVVMREGDPGEEFVIVEAGEIDVSVGGEHVQRLGRGSGVGEVALLRRSARTATVTAATPVRAFVVDAATFACAISGPASIAESERIASAYLARAGADAAGQPTLALDPIEG
jgi:MFS family permease